MIDESEQFLLDLGFHQVRVRYHDHLARIETDESGFDAMLNKQCREKIHAKFKQIGFTYIAVDIKGYQNGQYERDIK